ncbi:hypothetical protein [Glycomyces tritici]|uniref:Uncharacterized protein n=1 Tax=Glycomyces tritici TaxID=2665176 RepID=A0ABT7YTK2_9ACTN|nr:hypothetical protein [Glycomyces tritici]MDN3241920.1 hypothetical protein [Glycomyces tritici]
MPPNRIERLEAAFGRLPAPQRLALAAEHLEWTVANFAAPLEDPVTRDLARRAAAAVRAAVDARAAIAPAPPGFIDELDESLQDPREPGGFDLLISYYLCFDDLAPELRPDRLVTILDHCREADSRRHEADDDDDPRGEAVAVYQRALLRRHLGE